MASAMQLTRRNPLADRQAAGPGVQITPAGPASRLSLRGPEKSTAALSKALGINLPTKPKTSATKGPRMALWLGPDEWLIIDAGKTNPSDLLAKARIPHSSVDVSHRNTAIKISGANAVAVLAAGCPQDLRDSSFPVGACSRTVFGKAEVVLFRVAEHTYRLECWRSFSTYVFDFLEEAARNAGA